MKNAKKVVTGLSLLSFFLPSSIACAQNTSELLGGSVESVKQSSPNAKNKAFALRDTHNVLFVLDVSESMGKNCLGTQTSLQKACQLIENTIKTIPDSVDCGLRLFGTESDSSTNACGTKLVVPLGSGRKKQIQTSIRKVVAPTKSNSSMSVAIKRIVEEDLRAEEGNTIVIILSNGIVDSGLKTLEYVNSEISNGKLQAKLFVVNLSYWTEQDDQMRQHPGFADLLKQYPDGIAQLKKIAAATNGSYFDLKNLDEYIVEIQEIHKRRGSG